MSAVERAAQARQAHGLPGGDVPPPVTRVVHVLPGLAPGGAERLLLAWVEADAGRTAHLVLTLRPGGALTAPLRAAGAQVLPLIGPRRLAAAIAATRRHRPQTVVGWLHHGNAVALAVHALAAPRARLCFSHHGGPHPPPGPWHRRVAQTVERAGWRRPHAHLYAARTSARWDAARGRSLRRAWVLPAGIDTEVFSPKAARRAELRLQLGLPEHAKLVGILARYDPAKDHPTGLRAFFHAHAPDRHLLCMGPGMHPLPEALAALLTPAQRAFVHTLPERTVGVAEVVASLDVLLVSSISESLPRVTLEAMACEVACVTTAVGDASDMIEERHYVQPVYDQESLSHGLEVALRGQGSEDSARDKARALVTNVHSPRVLGQLGCNLIHLL